MDALLRLAVDKAASDIFVTPGRAPALKINGDILPISAVPLAPQAAAALVFSVMDADQRATFERSHESNFAITGADRQRFRVSAFYQRGMPGMVLRRIETRIPTLNELGLPSVLESLAMTRRGLIMFVGATGMGKSTSLAAMIGHRNRHSRGHIISIEDPIEFLHEHDGCIVTQREVGIDTESFEIALRNTLRQAPDVIMIGEVRSRETMEHALAFAETGHLCLCTLHANNANQALDRVLQFFPAERHGQVLMDLSLNLRAVVAQQLLPAADGTGRCPAIEILQNSPLASDHIRKAELHL
ncbi:MAG: PilT/PilU family type 4a pilus ATPase, partial [Pseudomonadales bacterium]